MNKSKMERMMRNAATRLFTLGKKKESGLPILKTAGTIHRTVPKIRKLEVEVEGQKIVLRGKSLRRHRIKQNRIAREAKA